MFSMKLRQMEKLNSGQSFGRESNDLNVLAKLELWRRKVSPGSRRGRSPGVLGGSPKLRR